MSSIKMLESKGSYKAGDTAHVTPGVAALLIESGYAEPIEPATKRGRPSKTKTEDASTDD